MIDNLFIPLILLLSYLSGSIPYGLLLTRLAGLGDVRELGSGNIGATNVLRTGNKGIAVATLFLDFAKGLVPVLLAYYFFTSPYVVFACGLAAILGHVFPVWLKFKGGKGVATALGVYGGVHVLLGLFTIGAWLVMAKVGRISSLSALIAFLISPIIAWLFYGGETAIFCGIVTTLILFTHRQNLKRILLGQESKISL